MATKDELAMSYEERQARLRAEGCRLKGLANQTSKDEWLATFFAIIEREKVQEVERHKLREYEKNHGGTSLHRVLGASVVETRNGR